MVNELEDEDGVSPDVVLTPGESINIFLRGVDTMTTWTVVCTSGSELKLLVQHGENLKPKTAAQPGIPRSPELSLFPESGTSVSARAVKRY